MGIPTYGQDEIAKNADLHILFREIETYERSLRTMGELYRGQHPLLITIRDSGDYEDQLATYAQFKERIDDISNRALNRNDQISCATMQLKLMGTITELKFEKYLIPFSAEGGFYNNLGRSLQRLPFQTVKDFEKYMNWLPQYADYLESHIVLLEQGIEKNIIAPKVIVSNTLKLLEPWRSREISTNPFAQMLQDRPNQIEDGKWGELKEEVLRVLDETVLSSYNRLYDYFANDYYEAAFDEVGISKISGGKEYYEERVEYFTTLNLSPEDVFNKGEEEVSRIRSRMEEIIVESGFEGSFKDFIEYLRTDEQFYAKTPQELLSHAAWLSKKAEGQLPSLFSHLYQLPFTVEPVPDEIAPTYTAGRYVGGNREQDRAGIYWVNTYNLPARSLYNLPALTVHEAVPGHHLQNMIAAELKDIPSFRNRFYISAFGEGWGLYSEYLGEEMNMYTTPYEWFGRYTYEMWRACRLVIDVGLHYKGWTREQAVQFLSDNTALSIHEVNTEIDRYIGWPGQALSYKIGEIKIKELRKNAEAALGDHFDIKEFHYQVLKNGSVPLLVLENVIRDWVDSKLKNQKD